MGSDAPGHQNHVHGVDNVSQLHKKIYKYGAYSFIMNQEECEELQNIFKIGFDKGLQNTQMRMMNYITH